MLLPGKKKQKKTKHEEPPKFAFKKATDKQLWQNQGK